MSERSQSPVIGKRQVIQYDNQRTCSYCCSQDLCNRNCSSFVNLALHKPAYQSTTGFNGTPEKAVDGDITKDYFKGSCTHANNSVDTRYPWWAVDLGNNFTITKVKIHDRNDAGSDDSIQRSHRFDLWKRSGMFRSEQPIDVSVSDVRKRKLLTTINQSTESTAGRGQEQDLNLLRLGKQESSEDWRPKQTESLVRNVFAKSDLNADAVPFQSAVTSSQHSIGQDLWKQLKRVQIPVFSGEKRQYQSWKAAFTACIVNTPATPEYKLLQLRQYLGGEALKVVDNLGHSATAYEAANSRLERKYGGKRRQIAIYLEDIENFRPIRADNSKDMEKFADLLDIAVINLQEAGQYHEMGDGSLYTKLQKKMPELLLAKYHRWVYEKSKTQSVVTLREWVLQEAEFQTIASETVHGLTRKAFSNDSSKVSGRNQYTRTFFSTAKENVHSGGSYSSSTQCSLCRKQHGLWNCPEFLKMDVPKRWDCAKHYKLCYRCLGDGHHGNSCLRSRVCRVNGCKEVHNKLLHRDKVQTRNKPYESVQKERLIYQQHNEIKSSNHQSSSAEPVKDKCLSSERGSLAMEGNKSDIRSKSQTTMVTQGPVQAQSMALRTVPVVLRNGSRKITVNALLDDASTRTYINSDVAAELGLQGKIESATVNVLNGQIKTFETTPVQVRLESLDSSVNMSVTAYTADRVTGNMKVVNWNKYAGQWRHLEDIKFPEIASRAIVDILIGLDCADLHYSFREIRGRPGEPIARLTPLGWTCIGNPDGETRSYLQTNFVHTYFVCDHAEIEEVNRNLQRFWEVEEVPSSVVKTAMKIEDQKALQTAETSLKYDQSKYKYQIGIPWKQRDPVLPYNFQMAFRRLQNTEKRLVKDPEVQSAYVQNIQQYVDKGYVRKVPQSEEKCSKWYLPHFPVVRPDKDTTKTRIVFDASAKCECIALNDVIYQGPKLQRELFDVLLRFRRYPVALVCDIAEMYLRIEIAPDDRLYHRFLWREMDQNRQPDVYEFNRVVFGVNSSPFQAQFVSQQHAMKHQDEFPMAAETVLKSTYMDDSMDSVKDEKQGIALYRQLSQLWALAGMHARKWLSNSVAVLKEVPLEDRKLEVDIDRGQLPSAKTLGVWWLADEDVFTFRANPPHVDMRYSKRNFLKKIATLFDPVGFLAPFIIRAKLLLQDMWSAGVDWDDNLNETLANAAKAWFGELRDLDRIRIPRCLPERQKDVANVTLHTFVDASQDAYGAVVYARYVYNDSSVSSRMIAAKSRVAPIVATSIPRLELMGAVFGLRLAVTIAKVLDIQMSQVVFWSDSLNVLWWIRGRSREFKPFVANRVGEIQNSSNQQQWRYVPTNNNPADFLSKGMKVLDLAENKTWWRGPDFLEEPEENWPVGNGPVGPITGTELKRCRKGQFVQLFTGSGDHRAVCDGDMDRTNDRDANMAFVATVRAPEGECRLQPVRFSSWLRLTRVQAWVNRFLNNCQLPPKERLRGELSAEEIKAAEIQIIRHTQQEAFREEWIALVKGKQLSVNSRLLGLHPRIDEDGLMRSDGRLKNAEYLSYDVRFPVILPRKNWVTKLIVRDFHERGRHASGTNQTFAALSTRFWIISAREEIREWERECAECRRRKAKACRQIMAPLPIIRLKTSLRAFARTSVDFGGPFITMQGRGKRREKRYLCLFTCLATRAVHLEMAFGLDTDSFLNAFYRMASRRGLAEEMLSDNGTNYKSADKELQALVAQLDEDKIKASAANRGVQWHFNPPLAPHFGGVHETMIKAAKKAINAILGTADITDEELMTAFTGAEALINSRPLTYQSANPEDDTPLTPNHFLHGQIGGQFAPQSVDETDFHLQRRWRRIQELVRHFWKRWIREWLPSLNAWKNWFRDHRDIRVGEVVLVMSPDTPRGNWPLGRVLEVYPGKDNHVRVAKVQVGRSVFVRSITKLCPLECDQEVEQIKDSVGKIG